EGISFGLPAESIMNDFELADLDGRRMTYSQWRGTRLAVIFVQPECVHSRAVIDAVARRPPSDRMAIFVTTGEREANRDLFRAMPPEIPILLQEEVELARVWRVMNSPAVYLIAENGVT